MKLAVIVVTLAAVMVAMPASAQKKKVQCWTDKNGQRMCGDRVPQEYAGEKRDVMKDGRVIDTISATKSADEKAAEERKKKAEEEMRKAAEYDRALLESYRTPADIIATRNERLTLVDSRIQAAEKNSSDTDKTLNGLRARATAQQEKKNRDDDDDATDERIAKQILQFEKAQTQNAKALERYKTEHEALRAKFDRDYMRFSELRGLPVTAPPPPPTAAEAAAAAAAAAAPPAKKPKPGAVPATPADPKAGTPATPATPPKKAG